MRGLSFSDFANENLDLAAAEALQQCSTIVLSERDMSAFVEALLNPDEPDERSKRYARLHLEVLGAQEAPD